MQVVFELQRKLVWDFVQSTIVHSCDGGLYLRTQPQVDSGDWYALSGNLSVAEMHSIAYDWKVRPGFSFVLCFFLCMV